jgi:L-malate glycosyltransferase
LMTGGDRERADGIVGYRGIPVTELARAFVDAGLEIEIATIAEEVEAPVTLQGDRLRLHIAPMRSRHRARDGFRQERLGLERLIKASDANVVHAHWTYEFAWAALDSGRPTIVTAHDAPLTVLRWFRDPYRAVRTAMAYVARFRIRTLTAVSPYLASRWQREMGYRRPIHVIPNFAPALPLDSTGAVENGSRRIIDVADSSRRKNIASLVRAFGLLRDARPGTQLDLVGPGLGVGDPLPDDLARQSMCRDVRFLGMLDRDALASALADARVFVHPSQEDPCPTSVLEAMRAGIPVVGGVGAGGVPWMLDHGHAGVLVDVEVPAAIAHATAKVLDNDDLAQEISARGRRRIEECFSPNVVSSAYFDLYADAVRSS